MKLNRKELRKLINKTLSEGIFDDISSVITGGTAPKRYIQNQDKQTAEDVAKKVSADLGLKTEVGLKSRDKSYFVRVYTPFMPGTEGYSEELRDKLEKGNYGRIMGNNQDSESKKHTFIDPKPQ